MTTVQTWLDFWNGQHRIYVSDRHRQVHYRKLSEDIAALIPGGGASVIDWGCGDALFASEIARSCGRLILSDAAEATRQRLHDRLDGQSGIEILAPETLRGGPSGIADLMVVNSVIQYFSGDVLASVLADARHLLKPGGALILADVIPPDDDIVGDVANLLRLGARHGFLLPALMGLGATFFSPYRRLRADLGLSRYAEAEILEILGKAGFEATRMERNLGFDQRRMAFRAIPLPPGERARSSAAPSASTAAQPRPDNSPMARIQAGLIATAGALSATMAEFGPAAF